MFIGNLYIEKEYERWLPRSAETAIDDAFLRRFVTGIFQGMVYGEIIIKRQWNTINVSLLIVVSYYFYLSDYTSYYSRKA